jgi:hypothetical protein
MKKIFLFFFLTILFFDLKPSLRKKLERRKQNSDTASRRRTRRTFPVALNSTESSLTELFPSREDSSDMIIDSEESTSFATDETLDSDDIVLDFDEGEALCEKILSQIDGMQDLFENIGVLIYLIKHESNSGSETGVYDDLRSLIKKLVGLNNELDSVIQEKNTEYSSVIFF